MNYTDYRNEKVFLIIAATILLYSTSLSVIAQNMSKTISPPQEKFRLSLFNVNYEFGLKHFQDISKINLFEKLNNENKASLKITSSNNNNLLLSYNENNPNKLVYTEASIKPAVIDKKKWDEIVKTKYKNGLIKTVSPGVKHIAIKKATRSGPLYINVVEINPSVNSNIEIKPALAGKELAQKSRISNIVKKNDALVGINASFFKPSSGVPLGAMVIDKEIIAGPIYNRVVLGIKDNGFEMAKLSIEGAVITENQNQIKIDNINQPRMLSSYVIIYSDKWGKLAPPIPKYGIQVAVENGIVTKVSKSQISIAPKSFVLVGPEKKLGRLKIGDKVNFKFTTAPDWSDVNHAVSGGPYLVKNGHVYIDAKEQKLGSITGINPRTAVGYTKDNRLIMITIDGRKSKSVGVSLYTLANIMKNLGCYNAMNFDGGSSTQMVVKGKVVNSPTSAGGNSVSNGLIVKLN